MYTGLILQNVICILFHKSGNLLLQQKYTIRYSLIKKEHFENSNSNVHLYVGYDIP